MPTPNDNETEDEFIDRCIPMLINEGKEPDQAVAICHSLWDNKDKSGDKNMKIKQKYMFDHNITIKSSDDDKYIIECIGTKESVDRDGDVLKIDGIDLSNYKKNPIVLWSHDYWGLPIGKTLKVWKEEKQLNFKIEFAKEDVYPFASTVYKMYKNGFLKSFSLGFRPDPKSAKFDDKRGGYDFDKAELIEISAVNVPANIHSVITDVKMQEAIKQKMFTQEEVTKLEMFLQSLEEEMNTKKEIIEDSFEIFKDLVENEQEEENEIKQLLERVEKLETSFSKILEQINNVPTLDNYIQELLSDGSGKSGHKTHKTDQKNQPSEDFEDYCKKLLV